jgi:hypothetical protein
VIVSICSYFIYHIWLYTTWSFLFNRGLKWPVYGTSNSPLRDDTLWLQWLLYRAMSWIDKILGAVNQRVRGVVQLQNLKNIYELLSQSVFHRNRIIRMYIYVIKSVFIRLIYMSRGRRVTQFLCAGWKGGEATSCLVQEFRTRGTNDAAPGQGWRPGSLLDKCCYNRYAFDKSTDSSLGLPKELKAGWKSGIPAFFLPPSPLS